MAGSFDHVNGPRRKFRMELIENMGDAHEALQQMHWLIWKLADGDHKKIKAAVAEYYRFRRANSGASPPAPGEPAQKS